MRRPLGFHCVLFDFKTETATTLGASLPHRSLEAEMALDEQLHEVETPRS